MHGEQSLEGGGAVARICYKLRQKVEGRASGAKLAFKQYCIFLAALLVVSR